MLRAAGGGGSRGQGTSREEARRSSEKLGEARRSSEKRPTRPKVGVGKGGVPILVVAMMIMMMMMMMMITPVVSRRAVVVLRAMLCMDADSVMPNAAVEI